MNKEQIKEKCAEIEKALKDGKTPQEIAEMFNPEHVWEPEPDDEYVYFNIDFIGLAFGINFLRYADGDKWWWENDDEIYLFEANDWAHWKSL